jgi:predicted nucleic acid-binding protein
LIKAREEALHSFYHHQIEQQQKGDILSILGHTKGIWQHGDGLQYQKKLRGELPDAFQAALASRHDLKLVTRNTKDFNPKEHHFVTIP